MKRGYPTNADAHRLRLTKMPNAINKVKLLFATDSDPESNKVQGTFEYGIRIVDEEWLMRAIEQGIDIA